VNIEIQNEQGELDERIKVTMDWTS